MKRICYFCGSYMGEKGENHTGEIFRSVCDECSGRLRVEERLPELLLAIAELRKQNGNKEHYQPVETLVAA
ncbi:MAG: hypothetical protein V3V43_03215 [Dehalococcoidales bacterium]